MYPYLTCCYFEVDLTNNPVVKNRRKNIQMWLSGLKALRDINLPYIILWSSLVEHRFEPSFPSPTPTTAIACLSMHGMLVLLNPYPDLWVAKHNTWIYLPNPLFIGRKLDTSQCEESGNCRKQFILLSWLPAGCETEPCN